MLPLRDIQERRTFPIVNTAIIIVNVLVFLYELSLGTRLNVFLMSAAFVPANFFQPGAAVGETRSIFVSMFLHGGWMHLLGNMLYLWIFGDNIEDRLGRIKYVLFYLLCGVAATLAHGLSDPHSSVPSVGASGAIAGVLGAYLLTFPKARVLTLVPLGFYTQLRELPAILVLGGWFVLQFFSGIVSLGARGVGGVAWWAHIGGFLTGMALIKLMDRGPRPESMRILR